MKDRGAYLPYFIWQKFFPPQLLNVDRAKQSPDVKITLHVFEFA